MRSGRRSHLFWKPRKKNRCAKYFIIQKRTWAFQQWKLLVSIMSGCWDILVWRSCIILHVCTCILCISLCIHVHVCSYIHLFVCPIFVCHFTTFELQLSPKDNSLLQFVNHFFGLLMLWLIYIWYFQRRTNFFFQCNFCRRTSKKTPRSFDEEIC